MAGVPYKITVTQERPADVSERQWREFMRQGHGEMGEQWHREFLPRHFQIGARERYGYQARTRGYTAKKRNMYIRGLIRGTEAQDLVFSGEMRSLLSNLSIIRAFPTRATVEMVGPRYVTFKPFKSSHPHKYDEVTRVIPSEERVLSETLNNRVTSLLDAYREPKTEAI